MKPKTNTETKLKVLVLEDSIRDLKIMREQLLNAGFRLELTHVENEAGFTASLSANRFDLILSDFSLPGFDAFGALKISKKLCPETPFICVSGSIGEETAVEILRLGAVDYVLKDRPERLPFAVKQALAEAKIKADYKKAEEALQESEAKFRFIAENSIDCIWQMDNKLRFTYVSPSVYRMTGYTQEEWVGTKLSQHATFKEFMQMARKAVMAIKNHKSFQNITFEAVMLKKDGSEFPVEISSKVIYNERGFPIGLQGTTRDITEQKQAEEKLANSHQRLRFALQGGELGMWDWNPQDSAVIYSDIWAQMLEYKPDEVEPNVEFFKRHIHPEDLAEVLDRLTEHVEGRLPVYESEHRMRTKSGRWLWVMDRGKIAERDKDGSPLRVTGIIADITERKKAEEALRESEMRFRNILGTVPDMISIHSPEMDILYSNWQGFGAVPYNMRKTDTKCYKTYRGCNDVCPDCLARDVLKTKQPMREEAQLPDGSWVDLRVIPLIDENDKVEMFMEWVRDITDQKKAEEEIKMLAHSLKNINECVSITDLEDKLIFVNDSFLDTYGYNRDELIGKHISLVDSPKNTPQLNAEIMSATFSGGWSGDIWNRRKDGSEFPINLSTKIIYDKDNKPFSLIGVAQDITERKQAEEALAMQNALLKTQQELSLDGILVVDADDKIISFNQRFADIWDIPDNIMALQSGEKALNYVLPMLSDQENFVQRIHELYKNKQAKSFEEIPLKDGRVLERYSAPIIEDQQYYHGRVWFYRDITERKKAEEEQENLRQQLAHSQKIDAVGRLAAGVAHDYNNTLSVVLGYAELILLKLNENHPVFNSIKEIQKAAERSSNLTRQLMTFARREPVNTRVINLNEAIENMMGMLRKLIRSNISLNWQPGKELWSIIIDPVQIDQILVNLCVNASDAIDGLGSVTIETRNVTAEERITRFGEKLKPGDYVLLKVSDDGCGMDEKTLGKIFEPFFTSKSEGQGTGLGLATVHGAVRQNNGLIDVESELGVGTTLYIFLPRSEQKVLPETEDKETHENSLKEKVTVLVVDDDETIPEMLKPMIEILGHEVLTACKPTDAIELFKQNSDSISLLISDVMMPEMNGVELANRLLEIKPDLKILFSSGYSSDIMTEHKMAAGMVNFITKPFKMKSLHAKIAEVLDN